MVVVMCWQVCSGLLIICVRRSIVSVIIIKKKKSYSPATILYNVTYRSLWTWHGISRHHELFKIYLARPYYNLHRIISPFFKYKVYWILLFNFSTLTFIAEQHWCKHVQILTQHFIGIISFWMVFRNHWHLKLKIGLSYYHVVHSPVSYLQVIISR